MTDSTFLLDDKLKSDSHFLMDLPLCTLLLANDSNYPWFILVPRVNDISEVYQLEWQQQQQLLNESSTVAEYIHQYFNADKINVAALGNVVKQLHIHHVVRYKSDASWPAPIWGNKPTVPYSKTELENVKSKLIVGLTELFN